MKVHVKKKAGFYTVYQDAGTLGPAFLAGPDDEPLGAVGLVPCTKEELEMQYPGAEFVIHEQGAQEQVLNKRAHTKKRDAALAQFKANLKPEEEELLKNNASPPVTGEPEPKKASGGIPLDAITGLVGALTRPKKEEKEYDSFYDRDLISAKNKADEFLKRIEFAIEYASDENKYALEIQVSVIKKLIAEVFG